MFRIQLKNKARGRDETLPELAQSIGRLTRRAYPTADYELQETLAKEHFMDVLYDADVRWRVFQSHPTNIDEAVRVAVELEAFQTAERQRGALRRSSPAARVVNTDTPETSQLEQQFAALTSKICHVLSNGFNNLQKHVGTAVERIGNTDQKLAQ